MNIFYLCLKWFNMGLYILYDVYNIFITHKLHYIILVSDRIPGNNGIIYTYMLYVVENI